MLCDGTAVTVCARDRDVLRKLAEKVRVIAEHPRMKERRRAWKALHELRTERPVVQADSCWRRVRPEPSVCVHPLLDSWEDYLRSTIYQFEFVDDDRLVWPSFPVVWNVKKRDSHYGIDLRGDRINGDGGYAYIPLISDASLLEEEVARLPHEKLEVDREETARQLDLANEIFGDILPPRLHLHPRNIWWTQALAYDAVHILGFNNFLIALCDNPQGVHALMAYLRDDRLANLQYLENEGLLTTDWNNGQGLGDVIPGGQRAGSDTDRATLEQLWAFAECQELSSASPQMLNEFALPYIAPIVEKFGFTSYGCCEPLDDSLDLVMKSIPNVRKIAVTAWANQARFVDIGKSVILSRRPSPAMICTRFDEDEIRDDIRTTFDILGDCHLEIVMKDVETLQNEPERIRRWVEIVREH